MENDFHRPLLDQEDGYTNDVFYNLHNNYITNDNNNNNNDDDEQKNTYTFYLLVSSVLACFSSAFQYGYNIAVFNSTKKMNYSYYEWLLIVSAYAFGGVFGSSVFYYAMDYFLNGRRRLVLWCSNFLYIIGGLLMLDFKNLLLLVAGRLVTGVGAGIGSVVAPIYLCEISTSSNRGVVCAMFYTGICAGLLAGSFTARLFSHSLIQEFPYTCSSLTVALAVINLAVFPFCAESPIYLCRKGNFEESKTVLKRLRGTALIDDELDNMVSELNRESGMRSLTIYQLFSSSQFLKRPLLIGISLHLSIQCSGVYFLHNWTSRIFKGMKIWGFEDDNFYTIVVNSISFLISIVALFLMERVGRRILLLSGFLSMCFCYIIAGTLPFFVSEEIIFYLICGVVVSSALGPGPIHWVLPVELFPQAVRSKMLMICVCVNWLGMSISIVTSLCVVDKINYNIFFIAGGFCFLFGSLLFYIVPETQGKSIPQVHELLGGIAGVYGETNVLRKPSGPEGYGSGDGDGDDDDVDGDDDDDDDEYHPVRLGSTSSMGEQTGIITLGIGNVFENVDRSFMRSYSDLSQD